MSKRCKRIHKVFPSLQQKEEAETKYENVIIPSTTIEEVKEYVPAPSTETKARNLCHRHPFNKDRRSRGGIQKKKTPSIYQSHRRLNKEKISPPLQQGTEEKDGKGTVFLHQNKEEKKRRHSHPFNIDRRPEKMIPSLHKNRDHD